MVHLSKISLFFVRYRDFWHEDDDDEYEDEEDLDEDLYENDRTLNENRTSCEMDDRVTVFGDSVCNYATSMDYRNTIDLREIGIESKRDTLLDLKSGQAAVSSSFRLLQTRLNIAGGMAHARNNMVADHHSRNHHHHHHNQQHQEEEQQQEQQQQRYGYEEHEPRQHQRQGWSKEECFNFRFTDKSQSAPSLPSTVDQSAHGSCSLAGYSSSSRVTSFVSTSNLFENYTRVASVPVDLNLCGVSLLHEDDSFQSARVSLHDYEMAEVTGALEKKRLDSVEEVRQNGQEEEEEEMKGGSLTSSVRTQAPQGVMVDGKMVDVKGDAKVEEKDSSKPREKKQITSTVKTQDRGNCVLDIALAIENDVDGAIDDAMKQFKRDVKEANVSNGNGIQRTPSGRPRKVKNTASYELAQQFEVDERSFRASKLRKEIGNENEKSPKSPRNSGKKRVLNNASYELAQQCDYIKALQSSRGAFQRMDACDELEESLSGRSSRLWVTDIVQQMSSHSTSNLTNHYVEPSPDTRKYSKSTENLTTQFSMGPFTRIPINQLGQRLKKQQQDESILSQIKKNSDPFSVYGEDPKARALVNDEIDYPCLETKPIGTSSPEGGVSREETNARKPQQSTPVHENVSQDESHQITASNAFHEHRKGSDPSSVADNSKKCFIGDFYPEKIVRLQSQEEEEEGDRVAEEAKKNGGKEENSWPPWTCNRNAGERLWRVIVEKQVAEKESSTEKVANEQEEEGKVKERESEEEERKKKEAKGTEAARGQTVHVVRSPPLSSSSGNSDRLELSERSGNPAVAVAVDTNDRGDRDKRDEENAAATATAPPVVRVDEPIMSTTSTTKRGFVAAPAKKELPSTKFQRNTIVDSSSATMAKEERKKGGLGGFLQRFSRLRFSGRSKVPRSEVQKKSDTHSQVNRANVIEEKTKKEPDYIIIPLHPPEEEKRKEGQVHAESRTDSDNRTVNDVQRSSSNIR